MHINLTTRDVKLPNGVVLKPYDLTKLQKVSIGNIEMLQVPDRYTVLYQELDGVPGNSNRVYVRTIYPHDIDNISRYVITLDMLNPNVTTVNNGNVGRGLRNPVLYYPSPAHLEMHRTDDPKRSNLKLGDDYDCTPIVQSDFIKSLKSSLIRPDRCRQKMGEALMYHSHVYGLSKEDHRALVDDYHDYTDNHEGLLEYALDPVPFAKLLMRHTRGRQL